MEEERIYYNYGNWSSSDMRLIRPYSFGYQECAPLHTGGTRVCNYWVLHYVFSGTGIFETRGKTYHPKAGDMFVIRPNEWAFYAADGEDPWTYGWLDFYCYIQPPVLLERDVISDERLGEVFLSAYEQVKQAPKEAQDRVLYGKSFELLRLLDQLAPLPDEPSNEALAFKAIQYMEQNYMRDLSVAEMAELVHMETSHFVTLFRKTVGITPWKYLTNMRLTRATGILLFRDIPVKEVAELSGYTDVTSFSRSFKRQFGMSPAEYIKRYRAYGRVKKQK